MWQERWTADLIKDSLQGQFLFRNVPLQLGGSLRAHAAGLLACLVSFPAQGIGSLGLRHRIKFSRINSQTASVVRGLGLVPKINKAPFWTVSWLEGLGSWHQVLSSLFCRGWHHPQASCGQVLVGMRLGGGEGDSRG